MNKNDDDDNEFYYIKRTLELEDFIEALYEVDRKMKNAFLTKEQYMGLSKDKKAFFELGTPLKSKKHNKISE